MNDAKYHVVVEYLATEYAGFRQHKIFDSESDFEIWLKKHEGHHTIIVRGVTSEEADRREKN